MRAQTPPAAPATAARRLFHEQFPDERVILLLRKDFVFLLRGMWAELLIALGLIALVIAGLALDWELLEKGWFWIAWLVSMLAAAFWAFVDWFNWRYDQYIITDRRIVDSTRRFPFRKKLAEAQLDRVQDTSYVKDGLLANIFNYGTIVIQTAGEASNFQWDGMPDPTRAQAVLRQAVEEDLRRDAAQRSPGGLR